jgi:hypothetical protein
MGRGASDHVPDASAQVSIASVDCTDAEGGRICQDQNIHAFPTVRVYRRHDSHSHEDYHGERTAQALVAFVEARPAPAPAPPPRPAASPRARCRG